MPLYQGGAYLDRVLPPLQRARADGRVLEVLVVDDGSRDDGPAKCKEAGFPVLSSGGRRGPGEARNVGARAAKGDVVLFVDSDVVLHEDAPQKVAAHFAARSDLVALFGAYDERPAAPGIVSRYRNLLHHFVHASHAGEASTFWAGCGAVRREAFAKVGGFDGSRYAEPSIEDIELGGRLRRGGGRILLDPTIQGTHLKRWTFWNMLETDVLRRALPWGRLLQQPGHAGDVLNVTAAERAKALLAGLFFLALFTAAIGIEPRVSLAVAAASLVLAIVASRRFYAFVLRAAGLPTAIAAVFLHQLYFVYGAATYVWCVVEAKLGRKE